MHFKDTPKKNRILACFILSLALICGTVFTGLSAMAATTPTSLGLASHGSKAVAEDWQYMGGYKGQLYNGKRASDCAGLIYAYFSDCGAVKNCGGGASSQVKNCIFSNDISEGIPNIHGLVLTMPDYSDPYSGLYKHIGIYVGHNMAADNSDYGVNMRYESVVGNSSRNWTAWHLFDNGMMYASNGWYVVSTVESVDSTETQDRMVYYQNYEYVTDTTVDGYTIDENGFALDANGNYAAVDESILSNEYVSASTVKAYLATKYSGVDSTYDLIFGGQEESDSNGKMTGNEVRLREEPNTSSSVVRYLYKGNSLTIISEEKGESVTSNGKTSDIWYYVRIRGSKGYVSSLYVEKTGEIVSAPSAPEIGSSDGLVTMTSDEGASIYYTTDGSDPTTDSSLYSAPFEASSCTLKAIAVKDELTSEISTAVALTSGLVFTDVPASSWFYSAVDTAVSRHIFSGMGNGIFGPNRQITRKEFVTALANMAGADLSTCDGSTGFSDVPVSSDTMTKSIEWATDNGYISGFGDGTFHPDDPITREQMCVIIANFTGLGAEDEYEVFTDDSSISSWAKSAVYACRANGIVSGMGDNSFSPGGNTTRAQACAVMNSVYTMTYSGAGSEDVSPEGDDTSADDTSADVSSEAQT